MKYPKRLSFLNGFLNVVRVIIVLLLIGFSISFINIENKVDEIPSMIAILILIIGYFMIVSKLKKILLSIREKDPFKESNITNFKSIGYYILAIGFVEAVINYPRPSYGIEIIATSNGSIKPVFLLHLVLSMLSFILSDVFRMAMEIKDENDLTV